jgi:hypothetical protein
MFINIILGFFTIKYLQELVIIMEHFSPKVP